MHVREHVLEWIAKERELYADFKYHEEGSNRAMLVAAMETEGLGDTWLNFIFNYIKRAELQGLQTPQGRQQFGKAIVTMFHALETAVEIHGPLPQPGYPSGEIVLS